MRSLLAFLFVLLIKECFSVPFECTSSYYHYTIEVTYKSLASSQAIEVFQWRNHSVAWVTSLYGYGKDNLIETTNICLKGSFYQFICSSRLSSSWDTGSYFKVKAFGVTTVLHGRVDIGRLAIYSLYPFNPIEPRSIWKVADHVHSDNWYSPMFDDSQWYAAQPGSFYPIAHSRYYRFTKQLSRSSLHHFTAFELFITHLYNIVVYINGVEFISRDDIPDGEITYTSKREGIYSFLTVNMTVAIHVFSTHPVVNATADPFSSHLVLFSFDTPSSSELDFSSEHQNDYYAHPLSSLFDGDVTTSWWFKGAVADVSLSYVNPLGEYANEYTIASSGERSKYDPRSWELYGSNDNIEFELLDARSNEFFSYRMEKKSYLINNMPRNYRYYKLHIRENNGDARTTTISLFSLSTRYVGSTSKLKYPQENVVYFEYEIVHITPLTSGFSNFKITSTSDVFPEELEFDSISGSIHGRLMKPLPPMNITIEAENMKDHGHHVFTLSLEGRQCSGDYMIILVQKWNQMMSSIEIWNITNSEGSVVKHGENYYILQSQRYHYSCIKKELFTITSYIDPNAYNEQIRFHRSMPGMLSLSLPYPIYDTKPFHLVKDMSFYEIAGMIMGRDSQCVVNPVFSISPTTQWKANTDYDCTGSWKQPSFDDSTWVDYVAMDPTLPESQVQCFRTWISIASLNETTTFEIKVRHYANVDFYVNGEQYIDYRLTTDRAWMTVTIPLTSFTPGKNLIAVKFSPIYWHSAPISNFALRLVGRFVYETEVCSRGISMSVKGDDIWPYVASNLMSYDLTSVWRSDFNRGKTFVLFKMNYNSHHFINKYCITNSPTLFTEGSDAKRWTLFYVKAGADEWIEVDSQYNVFWSQRLQTQCFMLLSPMVNAQQIYFRFEPISQDQIELSRISFHVVTPEKIPKATLAYYVQEFGAFLHMPIVEVCPREPFFNSFEISPLLPRGLYISHGTGCIQGTVTEAFQSHEYTITALRMDKVEASTTLRIIYEECKYPSSTLSIQFNRDQENCDPLLLDIYLYNSDWVKVRSSTLSVPKGSALFTHCLPVDSYTFSVEDYSAQGDLHTTWYVYKDSYVVSKGILNPGFPQLWFQMNVNDFFDGEKTQWYYDVSGEAPPADWYNQIDPHSEPWETSIPSQFPGYRGITQYFKTVLELPSLDDLYSIVIHFYLEAGIVLYANGKELYRFNLPPNQISHTTLATDAFDEIQDFTITLPVQFSCFEEGRNVIAIETHLVAPPSFPKAPTFRISIDLEYDHSSGLIDADAIDMTQTIESGFISRIPVINDGNYYNKYFRPSNCTNQEIHFFSYLGQPSYVSRFMLFSGDSPEANPHHIQLSGRLISSLSDLKRAKEGKAIATEWIHLMDLDDIEFSSSHYGQNKNFPFYNERMLNEFRFILNDCGKQEGFEIAEIAFYTSRIQGFCDIREIPSNSTFSPANQIDYSMYIPSKTWHKAHCPMYYDGYTYHFCNNGNWTDVVSHCHCKAPLFFRYPVPVLYIHNRKFFSIVPSTKGAELAFFFKSEVPEGIQINHRTGEISGEVRESIAMMSITVLCSNPSGSLETSLVLMTVNNHEFALVVVAVTMVILFGIVMVLIFSSMKKKKGVKKELENPHLHVDELSDTMRSFLL